MQHTHAMRAIILACFVSFTGCRAHEASAPTARTVQVPAAPGDVRLVLQITIDQLRFDLITRMASRFGSDGFRKLLEDGTVYEQAHYTHTITETAVGHATLSTGALPREHGIVGNEWYDLAERREVYAVDDPARTLVGTEGPGRSPHLLLVPTLGDVLREVTHDQALVVAVSEKDRSAILLAGKRGRAYWLDDTSGKFVTSSYYPPPPAWIETEHESFSVERLRGKSWELFAPADSYRAVDDQPWEKSYKHLGNVFPHPLDAPVLKDFVKGIKYTPFADALVVDFVRELLEHEPLGKDEVPDLLAVSLSVTDYVGHMFGPESREAEDNLLHLDRTLAELLRLANEAADGRVLVVLSADHGACESPEWTAAQGGDAGRLDPSALMAALNQSLKQRFPNAEELVTAFVYPSLWLDEGKVRAAGLELRAVEEAVVELVQTQPGVARAFSRSALLSGAQPTDELAERVALSMHPDRSGHVYLVQKERWIFGDMLTATHGAPWAYDTHVPILFWGQGVAAQHVTRKVDPRDIVPTLAKRLGVPVPSGSSGRALEEVTNP